MKTGIVYFSGSKNIGDDIQSYAAAQLVSNPIFIEREELNTVSDELPAIISGWFMENPLNFPPSNKLNPLFISFHGKKSVVCEKHSDYYKKHEPIGCRDFTTLKLFESIGIKAYFSGCNTLTINSPIKESERGDEIIIVDLLRKNYTSDYRKTIKDNIIPKEWRNKVSYFSHFMEDLPSLSLEERMKLVETILLRYAKAKFVVTSLIHCALPCIAMGTPVLFVDVGFNKSEVKRDRFEGITNLMNIYTELKIPLSKRNFIHTGLRVLKIHRLLKHKIIPIPVSYFNEVKKNPPMDKTLINNLRAKINEFETNLIK
ncbi:MAG: hypothetical protein GQ564_07610 [Bacteroidales bacterium]|nr:hypothetical protein [Bacteroidales bacterium]